MGLGPQSLFDDSKLTGTKLSLFPSAIIWPLLSTPSLTSRAYTPGSDCEMLKPSRPRLKYKHFQLQFVSPHPGTAGQVRDWGGLRTGELRSPWGGQTERGRSRRSDTFALTSCVFKGFAVGKHVDQARVCLIAAAIRAFHTDQTSSSPFYAEGTRDDNIWEQLNPPHVVR